MRDTPKKYFFRGFPCGRSDLRWVLINESLPLGLFVTIIKRKDEQIEEGRVAFTFFEISKDAQEYKIAPT